MTAHPTPDEMRQAERELTRRHEVLLDRYLAYRTRATEETHHDYMAADDAFWQAIAAALSAATARAEESINQLLLERDAATDSTAQCLEEVERLTAELEQACLGERQRCADLVRRFTTPESGPDYGMMEDGQRAAVRRFNRLYETIAAAILAQTTVTP
jgi:hypothetical protein